MTQSKTSITESQIFLVGFMACGKSTVGKELAETLRRPFIDLDKRIEAEAGCTVAELFAREGEGRFRQLETEALDKAAQDQPSVIAPGGGAITRPENRGLMSRHGTTIWLDASFELCWQRIKEDGVVRPLAENEGAARERHNARRTLYQTAELRINITPAQTPQEIVEEIRRMLLPFLG